MAADQSMRRTVATRGGAVVALCSVSLMGFLHFHEDGAQTQFKVYADKLAGGLPTACNGLTNAVSPYPVIVGEVWSQQKCDTAAQIVVEQTQRGLAKCITGHVTQHAFDALSSFSHNFGVSAVCGSQAVKLINAGQLAAGCHAISKAPGTGKPVWSYVGDIYYPGLYSRRLDETALCLKPD